MEFIRKFFIFIFGVILFFLLFLLAITASVDSTVYNPGFIKEKLQETDLSWMVENVLNEMDLPEMPEDQKDKAVKDISRFMKTYIPQMVDDFYAYLDGDMEKVNSVIPLKELKEQIRVLAFEEFKRNSGLPEKEFENYWKNVEKDIPDTLDVGKLLNVDSQAKELEQFRKVTEDFKSASKGLTYGVIAVAALMLIMAWNIQRFLKTTGGILIAVSILLLLISGVYYLGTGIVTSMLKEFSGGEMDISGLLELIGGLFRSILIFGASYLGGGILFLILGNMKILSKEPVEEDIE